MSYEVYFNFMSVNLATVTGAAFCICLTTLLSYIIYAFSIREKSFEEVLEEQRKRTEQEELQQKNEKLKKEKEKKHKKWTKKMKEKSEQVSELDKEVQIPFSQPNESFPSDLCSEIEIVEPKDLNHKKKNKSSPKPVNIQPSVKGINMSEKVSKEGTDSLNVVKEEKKEKNNFPIKEEKKSLPVHEEKEKSPAPVKDEKKSKSETVNLKDKKLESPKELQKQQMTQTEVESSETNLLVANKKKKKNEHLDITHWTASKLLTLLKETPLEESENQILIDTLLNKQKEASEWKKTGDNQNSKKQREIEQKQNAIPRYQEVQEKAKLLALERGSQEKINMMQQEILSLTTRLKQKDDAVLIQRKLAEEKTQELEKILKEVAENNALIKKLEEEKLTLSKTVKRLETESKSTDALAELEKLKKSKDELQKVHSLLVEQNVEINTKYTSETKILNGKIEDMKAKLEKYETENNILVKDKELWKSKIENLEKIKFNLEEQLKNSSQTPKKEIDHLNHLLQESKQKNHELDQQVKRLSAQIDELTYQNTTLSTDLANLQSENDRLSNELAASNERVSGDGQEALQQNGEINGKMTEEQTLEAEKKLLEQEDEIQKLETMVADLNKEIELQKQKNNELREKNWKTVEALSNAEKVSEQKIREVEKMAESRIAEINEKLKLVESTAVDTNCLKELTNKLNQTEEKLSSLQEENSNNLQKCQILLQEKLHLSTELEHLKSSFESTNQLLNELKQQVQNSENNHRTCLQRLFPAISIDANLPSSEWLAQFETQAQQKLVEMSSCSPQVTELQVQLSELLKEREELSQKLNHCTNTLAETEKTLHNLSESAKVHEIEYKDKLALKEKQLEKVSQELRDIDKSKDELKSYIQQLDQLRIEHTNLQSTCETSENKVVDLEQKYEEVNKNYFNLQSQLDSKNQQIAKLEEEIGSVEKLKKELEDIKSKLDKEREINKNFNSQMVKLNSLVKIGQDALLQEQENVKKLQQQLSEKSATTNGMSSPPTISEDASGKK